MAVPIDENLNPSLAELYDDIYLDYYLDRVKKSFPVFLSQKQQFVILIRLMAWAVARSYQQPRILKYIYSPDFVMTELLPRLADTLSFTYPLEYPEEQLRILIKYLQKIRRTRGEFNSIKRLLRILETSEEDILSMGFLDYADIEVTSDGKGVLLIQYNFIRDLDFANEMLRLVMPAGYTWRVENAQETKGLDLVQRRRFDIYSFSEKLTLSCSTVLYDKGEVSEKIEIERLGG